MVFYAQLQGFLEMLRCHLDLVEEQKGTDITEVRDLISQELEGVRTLVHDQHVPIRLRILDISAEIHEQQVVLGGMEAISQGMVKSWIEQSIHLTQIAMSDFRLHTRQPA